VDLVHQTVVQQTRNKSNQWSLSVTEHWTFTTPDCKPEQVSQPVVVNRRQAEINLVEFSNKTECSAVSEARGF